jgi:hypothetical protein
MEKFRQNIFGIGEVYELQREGQWVEKNRESFREYGYFLGGSSAVFDRLDFSNDTAGCQRRGTYPFTRQYQAATGNSNFGYVNGGESRTNISRIDYSTEIISLRAPTILPTGVGGACSNNNFGYFGGGEGPAVSRSIIQRVDYSNDLSTPSIRGPLSQNRFITAGAGNANFGYFYGSRGATTRVDRINYSNDDTRTSIRGNFPYALEISSATGNNSYGYWLGGSTTTIVQRLDYANDLATGSRRGNLVLTIGAHGSATGNSNFGYVERGLSDLQRIDYSNDLIVSNIRGRLASSNPTSIGACSSASFGGAPVSYLGAPWSSTAPYGYFGGGVNPGVPATYSTVDRVDYTNDTNTATIRGPLSLSRQNLAATGNSNFGYFGGGRDVVSFSPSQPFYSTVDRIDYSNDTNTTSKRGNLTFDRWGLSATGNSNFGYFMSGRSPNISTVNRLDYSNDTLDATIRGPLSENKYIGAATGTQNFGYFGGGSKEPVPTTLSTVDRIDYSNDSVTASVRGPLSLARLRLSASGNSNFGYFAGDGTTVDRINYANDTATSSLRGPLSSSRGSLAATGNSNFGYFGGGGVATSISTVDRIDYSNDTQTASARGSLSSSRGELSASSSQAFGGAPNTSVDPLPAYIRSATKFDDRNTLDLPFKRVLGSYGYYMGGTFPGQTIIDRVDYSNDTVIASRRGNFTITKNESGACGTNNFGYCVGNPPASTRIERIDYSNDLVDTLTRGGVNYSNLIWRNVAVGNNKFGYFAHGTYSPQSSNIGRLSYSNDDQSTITRGKLLYLIDNMCSFGNSNFGYFGGNTTIQRINYSNDDTTVSNRGSLNSNTNDRGSTTTNDFGYINVNSSQIERVDYANDTATAIVRGPLSLDRNRNKATGNLNFGYFGGGVTFPFSTRSIVDRIDYSNDTATASVRGPLSAGRYMAAATTNARNS